MTTWLDKLIRSGGYESIALTGDKTLDTDRALAAKVIRFAGSLAEAATIKFPSESGADWLVINDTSKALTLTTGSGATVEVAPSTVRVVAVTDAGMVMASGGGSGGGSSLIISGEGPPSGAPAGGAGTIYIDLTAAAAGDPDRALYLYVGAWLSLTAGIPALYPASGPSMTLMGAYHDQIVVVSYEGEATITLHSSPRAADRVTVIDGTGSASDHPITVNGNGKQIRGKTTSYTLAADGGCVVLLYDGSAWQVVSEPSSGGGSTEATNDTIASVEPDCTTGGVVDGMQKALDARTIVLTGEPGAAFTFTATGSPAPVCSWVIVNATAQTANLDLDGDAVHEGSLEPGDMAVVVMAGGIARVKVLA